MMKQRRIWWLSCWLISALSAEAAERVDLNEQPASVFSAQAFDFVETSRLLDRKQTLHVRVQQQYAGFPVWGANAVIHMPYATDQSQSWHRLMQKEVKQSTMNGVMYEKLSADLMKTPRAVFDKTRFAHVLQSAVNNYQAIKGKSFTFVRPRITELVFVDDDMKAHWAYKVSFFAVPTQVNQPLAVPTYILDATSFAIYKHWNDLKTVQLSSREMVDGGGLGGNKKIGQWIYDGLPKHLPSLKIERDAATKICYLQNDAVSVRKCTRFSDLCKASVLATVACDHPEKEHNNLYWNGAWDAINGAYSPSNDALFNGAVIKDLYQNWYGMPVLTKNNKPLPLTMIVHLPHYENAYWYEDAMYFGDGDRDLYPLVSLGIAAHEISHGFTEQHANLDYANQPGGINEAFSDMAAQAAEYYAYGKNNWVIGAEIFKAEDQALRYMDHPRKDCQDNNSEEALCSIDHVSQYYEGLEVHYSSGLYNHVFYLLGEKTKGWDTKKAFDVMVYANLYYWTSQTQFAEGACGVVKAAQILDYNVDAVKAAFEKVGIELKPNCKT